MINIAVCDDEKCMSEKIEKLVEGFFRKKNTNISVSEYSSGEELLKSNERIDILFLDIGMCGMDGIETARRLRAHGYNGFLIFITVLKEMVFQSFEVQPFDYLVKPVQEEHFEKTMERLFFFHAGQVITGKRKSVIPEGMRKQYHFFSGYYLL